jgi:hypothetical protein
MASSFKLSAMPCLARANTSSLEYFRLIEPFVKFMAQPDGPY